MPPNMDAMADLAQLEPFVNGALQAVIETPRGSRNKYAYDAERRCFQLKKVLPAGMVFPYDFGFVPRTRAGDGAELDALVLMDEPAFPGCVVGVRLIGVIVGENESPDGSRYRNDRLLAVADASEVYGSFSHVDELPQRLLQQLEEFFSNYPNALRGKPFHCLRTEGPAAAAALLREAQEAAAREQG